MISKFINYVIRPKRLTYNPKKDLGPMNFVIDKITCGRIDFTVINQSNQKLYCSLYHRKLDLISKLPCLIYCHGNSGNRMDSLETLKGMLSQDIIVVTFDFAGTGLSDGDYVSLGYYERYDIASIYNHIIETYTFIDENRIGIWGRSMGAVSAILYAELNPNISLLVLDSAFSDFSKLLNEYLNKYKLISNLIGNYIYTNMREKIKEKANFDFEDLKPLIAISNCKIPALFIHGKSDSIVDFTHSKALYENHKGLNKILLVDSGHNDIRPDEVYYEANRFICQIFFPIKEKLCSLVQPKYVYNIIEDSNNQNYSSFHEKNATIRTEQITQKFNNLTSNNSSLTDIKLESFKNIEFPLEKIDYTVRFYDKLDLSQGHSRAASQLSGDMDSICLQSFLEFPKKFLKTSLTKDDVSEIQQKLTKFQQNTAGDKNLKKNDSFKEKSSFVSLSLSTSMDEHIIKERRTFKNLTSKRVTIINPLNKAEEVAREDVEDVQKLNKILLYMKNFNKFKGNSNVVKSTIRLERHNRVTVYNSKSCHSIMINRERFKNRQKSNSSCSDESDISLAIEDRTELVMNPSIISKASQNSFSILKQSLLSKTNENKTHNFEIF